MGYYFSQSDDTENPSMFTPWSIHHLVVGIFCYTVLFCLDASYIVNFSLSLIMHTIYEIKDFYKAYITYESFNSLENSIGDTISFLLGFMIANKFVKNKNMFFPVLLLFIFTATFFRIHNYD